MADRLTDGELIIRLRALAEHGGNSSAAARSIKVQRPAFNHSIIEAKKRGLTVATPTLSAEDKLRIELASVRKDLKNIQVKNDTAESIRTEIFNLATRSPDAPTWVNSPSGKLGARGTPMTMWSDWHFGEVVKPEQVGGMNEFTTDIAINRVRRLVDTSIDLAYNHMGRAKTQYPGVVVCLGGDMMTGNIHEELMGTNDKTPQEQINVLTDTLAAGIERMASKFGKAYVPCVVGNHGRDTKKAWTKEHVQTNHEWVIYTNLERYFRRDKHIHVQVAPETDIFFQAQGHRFLLTHGNNLGVKGGDGIIGAIGPIMRGKIKTSHSEAHIGREFDTIIMGHWHQMLWLPGCIVNNSLKGYDEFARLVLRAPYSRPSQALWFVHPEHGITAKWEVFLEGLKTKSADTEWVSFEQRRVA